MHAEPQREKFVIMLNEAGDKEPNSNYGLWNDNFFGA